MKHIRGIIWDMDGTLLDSFGIFESVLADVVAETGHAMPSHEVMLSNFHGSLADSIQHTLGIAHPHELTAIVDSFLDKQAAYYSGELETHLFRDAAELARRAAEHVHYQVIVTNRKHGGRQFASPRHIVAATTLADYIHEVRPGDEVTFRKPDSRSLGDWFERVGLAVHEAVVIGDQFVDAQLAVNIGCQAIIVKRHDVPSAALDELRVSHRGSIHIVDSLDSVRFD